MATQCASLNVSAKDRFAHHAEQLSLLPRDSEKEECEATTAVEAVFITPHDPVIQTANGNRLPTVPVEEALKLNRLRDEVESAKSERSKCAHSLEEDDCSGIGETDRPTKETKVDSDVSANGSPRQSTNPDASLRTTVPSSRTHPLFPPLPLYGPPSAFRNLQCVGFRVCSFFLSLTFLGTIVLGSIFTSIPPALRYIGLRLTSRNPNARRPFYEEEKKRQSERRDSERAWNRTKRRVKRFAKFEDPVEEDGVQDQRYEPTEGGKDPIVCDVGYYARRVGLDMEEFKVQTEDGFILNLWHVYNPLEYSPVSASRRSHRAPKVFYANKSENEWADGSFRNQAQKGKRRYPILLTHGLLQSAGAYCTNDDDSLAFFLCKSGYDVWLGNNRCGFKPEHQILHYGDPRMWSWNIRQMGVIDLPALISRVLSETNFEKLGLLCHSQGTTETFVALAKEQRPDLGQRISVFCALAPAVYAGPLIGKAYFKFMRVISPGMFRMVFGIHAFIPFMLTMHSWLPGRLYGALGYRVFSFLFNWTDDRWDQGLRDRMFQFAPVYVSTESMRWWLGRECFAKQKCILATKDESQQEDEEDDEKDRYHVPHEGSSPPRKQGVHTKEEEQPHGRNAWYDNQVPPFALWVAGSDQLVDGRRLLRRFERGREPYVKVVHAKVIEAYEHLDVIWAMDVVDQVGKEVREVVWRTAPRSAREACRVPVGCEQIEPWRG